MNPLKYLHLQLRLEGKEVVNGDRLRQVEAVPDEEMPLMIVAQLADQQLVAYYDELLQSHLHAELASQVQNVSFPIIDPLLDILKAHTVSFSIGDYRTYVFAEHFMNVTHHEVLYRSSSDAQVQAFGFGGFPSQVYCIERDGRLVSACVSTRENDFCGETWVYTDEPYRHQGFAQRVVQAWAKELLRAGKVPFYSHKLENKPSASLANRLGLRPVFEEISIAYMNV